jgi:hypothetical protein
MLALQFPILPNLLFRCKCKQVYYWTALKNRPKMLAVDEFALQLARDFTVILMYLGTYDTCNYLPTYLPNGWPRNLLLHLPNLTRLIIMSFPISALTIRQAFARQRLVRIPARRFLSASKVEEAGLHKAPKRDPELYVRTPHPSHAKKSDYDGT